MTVQHSMRIILFLCILWNGKEEPILAGAIDLFVH
jgi:hypothetical protein